MDNPLVGIIYKLANGERISIDVTIAAKELLEQSDRQIRSQRRQDKRRLNFVGNVDELHTLHTLPHEDVASFVSRMDSYRLLYVAIGKLSIVQRRRLNLYYLHELTHRQIAKLEGVKQYRTCTVGWGNTVHSLQYVGAKKDAQKSCEFWKAAGKKQKEILRLILVCPIAP